ncbi:hypothetical protein A2U01_0118098, partial [Trifolium medium]|nr:hypothetical protein [Trifolium medium]
MAASKRAPHVLNCAGRG